MTVQPRPPDLASIKERQRRAWASGDYAMVGVGLLIISELLWEAVDLRPGEKVLDVASGSGNTALAAARRFCEATGVDYVPALLERGWGGPPPSGWRSRSGRATPRSSPSQTPLSTLYSRPSG
jgi:SAM-dependent methyltransferase